MISTVYAPATLTKGETFVWYKPTDRLQVGVAYLWKQGAVRGLANYVLVPETTKTPNVKIGFGLQGIATGNPGLFATSEKNWNLTEGSFNGFVGIGWRTNEDHLHGLAGFKFSPANTPFTFGMQFDGHYAHPFATWRLNDSMSIGSYAVEGKKLGVMVSFSF